MRVLIRTSFVFCIILALLAYQRASGQKSDDPPVFHGLKLGTSIGKQLSECQYEKRRVIIHSVDALCANIIGRDENSAWAMVYREYALHSWEDEVDSHPFGAEDDSTLRLLYSGSATNPLEGTIESVEWTQGTKQQLRVVGALNILNQKYGKPARCESHSVPLFDFTSRNTDCTWILPWGRILFKGSTGPGPADYIDVTAQTNRYFKFLAENKKSDSRKLKDVF